MVIVQAKLRNTRFVVSLELTPEEYAHYCYLRGLPIQEPRPLDQNVVAEMAVLLEHVDMKAILE